MLLIGSRAANYWHPECSVKPTSDWDVVCDLKTACELADTQFNPCSRSWKWKNYELHNADFFCNDELIGRYDSGDLMLVEPGVKVNICSSRGLATIKRSHLHRTIKWTHHMLQYQVLDHAFTASDLQFIERRKREIKGLLPDRVKTKSMSNEDFFDDAVNRIFEHDEIHRIISAPNEPLYLKLKTDKSKAAYDDALWLGLANDERTQAVREECYVIALERFLIPYALQDRKYPYSHAFSRSLEKACTTLDTGLFREYAIDNWQTIRVFDPQTFNKFFHSKPWRQYDTEQS